MFDVIPKFAYYQELVRFHLVLGVSSITLFLYGVTSKLRAERLRVSSIGNALG